MANEKTTNSKTDKSEPKQTGSGNQNVNVVVNATPGTTITAPPKKWLTALLLCIFLGWFGIHNYYCGKIGLGILYMISFGLFGIGWLIDIIRIACGSYRDRYGRDLIKN